MDSSVILSLLEQLDDEIDDLEDSLEPLTQQGLSERAAKLPLLDKAKLYVTVTYAIESMLFSYLRLNGVDARQHAVFQELAKIKQYFDKIKIVETPSSGPPTQRVDKAVAARFIKAGIPSERWEQQRAAELSQERARAHIKFGELTDQMEKKRKADADPNAAAEAPTSDTGSSHDKASEATKAERKSEKLARKKQKLEKKEKRAKGEKKTKKTRKEQTADEAENSE